MKAVLAFTVVALLFSCATLTAAQQSCSLIDYEDKYTACNATTNNRLRYLAKKQSVQCDGPAVLGEFNATVSCVCEATEFSPLLEACDTNTNTQQVQGYTPMNSCNVTGKTLASIPKGTQPCKCTVADIGYSYSTCDEAGVMWASGFWTRDCTPTNDLELPSAYRVPCELSCVNGEYLAAPSAVCQTCPAGQSSNLSDVYMGPYKTLPNIFTTSCYDRDRTCSGWEVCEHGECITSGKGGKGRSGLESFMTYVAEIVEQPAKLSFAFRTSTEEDRDFFVFQAGGNTIYWTSGENSWTNYEYEIPFESRECRWMLNGQCLNHNQLTPYNPNNYFKNTNEGQRYSAVSFDSSNGAANCTFPASYSAKVVFADASLQCTTEALVFQARSVNAAILVLYNVTHVFGNSQLAGPNLIVAHMTPENVAPVLKNTTVLLAQNTHPGKRISFDFIYLKDGLANSGTDEVQIRNIVITGTRRHATACTECPPGTGSHPGARKCLPCEPGTFSKNPGSAFPCQPCPVGHISPAGAKTCLLSEGCTLADYVASYGPCEKKVEGFRRTISFHPSPSAMCDLKNTSFRPPSTQYVACGDCNTGSYRGADGHCIACAHDEYVKESGDAHTCERCPSGATPERILDYKSFDALNGTLPSNWTRTCTSCLGEGWDFGTTYGAGVTADATGANVGATVLSVGRTVMTYATATLTLDVETELPGSISMTYYDIFENQNDLDNTYTSFQVYNALTNESMLHNVMYKSAASGSVQSYQTITLAAGKKRLEWSFTRQSTGAPVSFNLKSLTIHGVKQGGANSCRPCAAGYACNSYTGQVSICLPGTFSTQSSEECTNCAAVELKEGFTSDYSSVYGADSCKHCPAGLASTRDNRACTLMGCKYMATWLHNLGNASITALMVMDSKHKVRAANTPMALRDITYDLSSFGRLHRVAITEGMIHQPLFFKICDTMRANEPRCTTNPESPSFGCVLTSDNRYHTLGDRLSFEDLADKSDDTQNGGVLVSIAGGTCRDGTLNNSLTTLYIHCDAHNDYAVDSTHFFGNCGYNISIRSRAGCPVCNNDSFVYVDGECDEHGYKLRTYHYARKNGEVLSTPNCYSGLSLPQPRTVKCPFQVTLSEGFNAAWGIMTFVLVLLLILACCGGYQFVANRQLSAKYGRLERQQRSTEADHREMSDNAPPAPGYGQDHPQPDSQRAKPYQVDEEGHSGHGEEGNAGNQPHQGVSEVSY